MTRESCRMSGVGVVSVAAHLAGRRRSKRWSRPPRGATTKKPTDLNGLLGPLIAALFLEPNPMPLKAGLGMAWDPVGDPRLPLIPASDDTRNALESAARQDRRADVSVRCRLPRRPR